MLVGPSITLEKLEKHMADKLYEIKLALPKKIKEFDQLRVDFKKIPRLIIETNNGEEKEVVNPEFKSIPDQMKALENEIKEMQDRQDLLEEKMAELETIEDRAFAKGLKFDKKERKITLSLNDSLALGIDPEAVQQDAVQ